MTIRGLTKLAALSLSAVSIMIITGCSTPEGRIMGEEEESLVGRDRAGSATYDRLIETTVQKLLAGKTARNAGLSKARVAYLGVENKGIEELGDMREQIYELIDTSINQHDAYTSISRRFVSAALRETRLTADDLFLPKKRRVFVDELEAKGNPVEFLLFSKLTTGTTRGEEGKERNYLLTLELVDVESGEFDKQSTRIRKAYR